MQREALCVLRQGCPLSSKLPAFPVTHGLGWCNLWCYVAFKAPLPLQRLESMQRAFMSLPRQFLVHSWHPSTVLLSAVKVSSR